VTEYTRILEGAHTGEPAAIQSLFELVYGELRQLAADKLALESAEHTLQTTALVHEAWLRLGADAQPEWHNRGHFFAAAGEAMRRILVDRARRKLALRHGGRATHLDLDGIDLIQDADDDQLIAVNEALDRFSAVEPDKARLVTLRYFIGLTLEEAAQAMGISDSTAKRWWTYSRAWLFREIRRNR